MTMFYTLPILQLATLLTANKQQIINLLRHKS